MKERHAVQDLEGVQIDFEEDCEASERFADGEAEEATRDVIRGLEALWGKAPLPADFRDVLATPLPTPLSQRRCLL